MYIWIGCYGGWIIFVLPIQIALLLVSVRGALSKIHHGECFAHRRCESFPGIFLLDFEIKITIIIADVMTSIYLYG
jgi:hypothetical protein